ncbi:MAG: hypothetical protein EBZ93_04670, partial [Actinobacteria bacterium]|nr:hypothetical protein [Actinomycetota bacterium]
MTVSPVDRESARPPLGGEVLWVVSMRWFIQRHNHKGHTVDINTHSRQRLSALMRNASVVARTSGRSVVCDDIDNRDIFFMTRARRAVGSTLALFVIASTITFAPTSVHALSDVDAISGTTATSTNEETKDLLPDSPLTNDDKSDSASGEQQYITPTITPSVSNGVTSRPSGSASRLPGAIESLLVRPGNGELDITWVAPDPGEGGTAAATSYRVRHSVDGSTWSTLAPIEGLSAHIGGLTNGVVVFVEVSAMNAAGSGPSTSTSGIPASPASSPRGPGVPGPVVSGNPIAAAILADAPSSYWPMNDASATSSAAPAVGSSALSGGLSFGFGSPVAGVSSAYASGSTLTSGVTVGSTFTISAMIDSAGNGGDNAVLAAAGDHNNGFEFRQADRGALELVGFANGRAQRISTGPGTVAQGAWHQVAVVVDGGTASIVVDGAVVASGAVALGGGQLSIGGATDANPYRGWLAHVAVFPMAISAARLGAHWTATGYQAPSGNTPIVRAGDGYLLASWGAPANDGGSRIIGYRIDVRVSGGEWQTAIANTYSTSTSAMVTTNDRVTITNGVAHDVRVRAVTDVGAGSASDVATATPRGLALAPANSSATGSGSGAVNATWEAPINDGGFIVSGYEIEVSVDATSWSTVATASADTRSIVITNVFGQPLADAEYQIRVRARTEAGRGVASDAITVNPYRAEAGRRESQSIESTQSSAAEPTPEFVAASSLTAVQADEASQRRGILAVGGVPGRVGSLVATPTNGGANLTWVAPTDIGGASISGYTVQTSVDGATWTNVSTSATSPYVVTSLTAGNQYMYRVFASNSSGAGTPTTVIFTAAGNTSGNFASAPGSANAAPGSIVDSGSDNSTSYLASVTTDSPTGFWRLNENAGATTAVGSGSTALSGAATSVTFGATGPLGTAATFNGTSSKIVVPDNTTWNSPSITAEAWIKPGTQSAAFSTIIGRADTTTARNWHLDITQAGQLFAYVAGTSVISASGLIQSNVWQHVAVTFDGNMIRIYWNGTLVGSTATAGLDIASVPASITIGARNTTASNFYNGSISNAAVYSTALSAARIQNHVQSGGLAANSIAAPSVVVGDSTATVSWNAPSYVNGTITGYEIQTAPRNGGGLAANTSVWTTMATTTPTSGTLSYVLTGLTANSGVSIRVRAITTLGAGSWSIPTDAFVFSAPLAPTNLSASSTSSTELTLSWTAPTLTTNGSAVQTIVGYRIEQSADNGATWSTLTANTGSATASYVIDGLANGVTRTFRVAAVTANSMGAYAVVAAAPSALASAPRNLTALATGDGTIQLSWIAPSNTGGASLLGYILDYCNTQGCTPATVIDSLVPASTTSYSVTGMSNQQGGITFRLRPVTAVGTGDEARVIARTSPQVSAPTTLSAAVSAWESLSNQVLLSWGAPTLLFGQTVIGYQIEQSSDGGSNWITINSLLSNGTQTYVQGLTAGTNYLFRVAARTSLGLGLYNYVSIVPQGSGSITGSIASAPRNLTATVDPATSSSLLTWQAPTYTGGVPLIGYRIRLAASTVDPNSTTSTVMDDLVPAGTTSYRVTGLLPGTNFVFRVIPVTSVGDGDYGAVSFITYELPSQPRTLTATPGDGSVDLTWTAPSWEGGYNVYGYRVEQSTDGVNWTVLTLDTATTSISARGNVNGTTYQFRVAAVTAVGYGPYANIVATPYTTPNAPMNIGVVNGNETVTLSWSQPASNGSPITQYRIDLCTANLSSCTEFGRTIGAGNTSFTASGLTNFLNGGYPNPWYVFRVAAINAAGLGPWSTWIYTMPGGVAGSLQSLTAVPYNQMVDLNWACCVYAGNYSQYYTGNIGSPIVYRVEQSSDNGASWQFVTDRPADYTYARVYGLRNGVAYQFRVTAVNIYGAGVPSLITATPSTKPIAPSNLSATFASDRVTLSWGVAVDDGGSPIVGYRIRFSSGANSNPTTVLADIVDPTQRSYTVTGLTAGTAYTFVVDSVNMDGATYRYSDYGAQISVTPTATPSAVTTLTTNTSNTVTITNPDGSTGTGTYLTVTWGAPNAPGDVATIVYRVELSADGGTTWTTLSSATTSTEHRWAPTPSLAGTQVQFRVTPSNVA